MSRILRRLLVLPLRVIGVLVRVGMPARSRPPKERAKSAAGRRAQEAHEAQARETAARGEQVRHGKVG
jgi:hypothetical protein